MTTKVERPVLRYFGGKWKLAPWIVSHMPPHKIYVEPFGGAASVLMRKPPSYAEVYNDIDDRVVNVFRVLRDPASAERLLKLLELTPFARSEFKEAFADSADPVERARRTIFRAFAAVGSDSAVNDRETNGFRECVLTRVPASNEWVSYRDAVPAFVKRLEKVIISNREAAWGFDHYDSEETLFYVDPPYVTETRNEKNNYKFELTVNDHEALLDQIRSLKGMVMLSGYEHPLYNRLGWHCIKTLAQADGAGNRSATERVEVLWLNPAAVAAQAQQSLFQTHTSGGADELG